MDNKKVDDSKYGNGLKNRLDLLHRHLQLPGGADCEPPVPLELIHPRRTNFTPTHISDLNQVDNKDDASSTTFITTTGSSKDEKSEEVAAKQEAVAKDPHEEEALANLAENFPTLKSDFGGTFDPKIWLYHVGLLGSNNPVPFESVEWWKALRLAFETEATWSGSPKIQHIVGEMYGKGYGGEIDHKIQAKWYQLAAEQGHASAQFNLGSMYYGHGKPQDFAMAMRWYQLAANQGHTTAQYNLGMMYDKGQGVSYEEKGGIKQDYNKALEWYSKAAHAGHAVAQFNVGRMFYYGHGMAKDHEKALEWYHLAAEQGHEQAQFNLALLYEKGKNFTKAQEWLQLAANQGHTQARYNLGYMYFMGNGVKQDHTEAMKRFQLAAPRNLDACFNLGSLYQLRKDFDRALQWYEKAANQGHIEAQLSLGLMYNNGEGVPPNYSAAFEWLQRAASEGDDEFFFILGRQKSARKRASVSDYKTRPNRCESPVQLG